MQALSKIALAVAGLVMVTQVAAQVTFYEHDGFAGRSFTTQGRVRNLASAGFNDSASSVVVRSDRWEVCEDVRFKGRCVVLRPRPVSVARRDGTQRPRLVSAHGRQRYPHR